MTEENEYTKQAKDFLSSTGTTFEAKFLEYGLHFDGDKDKRNIFEITLSNKNSKYVFKFGTSINDSCTTVSQPITEVCEVIEVFAGLSLRDVSVLGSVKFKLTKESNFNLTNSELEALADDMCNEYNKSADKYNKRIKAGNKRAYFGEIKGVNKLKKETAIAHINKKITEKKKEVVETYEQSKDIIKPTEYDVLACLTKHDPNTFEDFCSEFGYDEDSKKAEKVYNAVVNEYNNVAMLFNEDEIEVLAEIH